MRTDFMTQNVSENIEDEHLIDLVCHRGWCQDGRFDIPTTCMIILTI